MNEVQRKPRALGIKRKAGAAAAASKDVLVNEVVGKDFYRTDAVNEGHYSRKRADVADVDPKVRYDARLLRRLSWRFASLYIEPQRLPNSLFCRPIGDGALPAHSRQASPEGRH